MNSETFSQKLLVALGHSKFDLDVSAIKMLNSAMWLPRVPGVQMTNIEGAEKADQLKAEFSLMEGYAPLLAFKFLLGQPLVACVLQGDSLSADESITAARTFFECINKCLPYTLQPNGTVSGFLIFLFFDSTKADAFISTAQQRCRYDFGGGTHTCVKPWAIDVPGRRLVPERQTWLHSISGFNPKKLEKDLFR